MGYSTTGTLILDAGGLIAIERDDRDVSVLCARTREAEHPLIIPAGVLAQVWRDGSRQVRLVRFASARGTVIESLDGIAARNAGALCGRKGISDVIDASVAIAARQYRARVISSDRGDLERLDPDITVIDC